MSDGITTQTARRWPRSTLLVALLLALSCVPFDTYSIEFRRGAGWKDYDGGGSTWIPAVGNGSGGRSLWLFGDGAFWRSGYTADPGQFSGNGCTYGPCPQKDASLPWKIDPNVLPMVGNTIAVHGWSGSANPWDTPSNITFYARKKAGATACGADATLWNSTCPVARITTDADIPSDPDVLNKAGGFIPKAHNTGAGETLPNHTDEYIWPKAAVYVNTPHYPSGYVVPDLFKSYAALTPQPFLVMGYQRKGPGATLQGLGFSIVTDVTAGDPSTWVYRGISEKIPIDPVTTDTAQNLSRGFGIAWGNALYYDALGDRIRIYGEIYQFNPRPTGSACLTTNAETLRQCAAKDMVLAVALNSHDIVEPSRWWYAYSDNAGVSCPDTTSVCRPCQTTYPDKPAMWSACYAPIPPSVDQLKAQLKHVADNIAGDFSVDKVCYDQAGSNGLPSVTGEDGCAFVLTHGAWRTANGCRPALSAPECALCVDDVTRSNTRWMMIRTTADDSSWPPASHGKYGTASGKQSTFVSDAIGDNWDRAQLCGENKGRQVRQLQAHDELSPKGALAISYYINGTRNMTQNLWTDGDSNKFENTRHGNLRFGALPLSYFRPWCEATGTCPDAPQPSCAAPAQDPCCGAVDQGCCSANTCATGLTCQDFFGAKMCWPPPHS